MNIKLKILERKGNKAERLIYNFVLGVSDNKDIQEIWIKILYNKLLFKISKLSFKVYKNRIIKLLEREKEIKKLNQEKEK